MELQDIDDSFTATPSYPVHEHLGCSSDARDPVSNEERAAEEPRPMLSWPRLAGLTCLILGVQSYWAMLMANGTPYLHSLGFPESLTSIVWMGGPFGAVFLSPVLGAWSDGMTARSTSRFKFLGQRGPFIVIGALGVTSCLLGLSFVRELEKFTTSTFGFAEPYHSDKDSNRASSWLVLMTIIWVYALNVSIASLQVGARALIVDCVSPEQQKDASAWVSRWGCSAAVYTFWLSSMDLPTILPFLGPIQFRALAYIEIMLLAVTIPISLYSSKGLTQETVRDISREASVTGIWRDLYQSLSTISPAIWNVFKIQVCAWNAWFPFLYYNTSWVGHLTLVDPFHGPTHLTDKDNTRIARVGSFAAFLYALVSLILTFVLPLASTYVRCLTMERLWFAAHVLFATMMFLTLFVETATMGTIVVTCVGFSWAMTQWAPFSLIAVEISRGNAEACRQQKSSLNGIRQFRDEETGDDKENSQALHRSTGAGAAFGLHNVVMGVPQMFAAVQIAVLFKALDAFAVSDKPGWALRLAGVSALGAIWCCKALL